VKALIDNRSGRKLSSNEFEATESPIDTEYFGMPCARVILQKACVDVHSQDQLLRFLQQFEFTTIINRANDPSNNRWLGERTRAFLTDINVQLIKKISATEQPDDCFVMLSDRFPEDSHIIRIAETAFEFSRFLNDPYLPMDKARSIYADITKNAFEKAGRYFVVFRTAEIAAGFLLFSIHPQDGSSTIELIAIDGKHKGQGIGRSLIQSMQRYVHENRIDTIQVGTQLENIGALKFYILNGFSFLEQNSVYHYWPSRGEK
jgi:ribosomal protein S18 acetylase RimI-like enzyme